MMRVIWNIKSPHPERKIPDVSRGKTDRLLMCCLRDAARRVLFIRGKIPKVYKFRLFFPIFFPCLRYLTTDRQRKPVADFSLARFDVVVDDIVEEVVGNQFWQVFFVYLAP